jgi:hypothetical protein
VFSAASPGTANTGVLRVGLSRRGVVDAHLLPATIHASRPTVDHG